MSNTKPLIAIVDDDESVCRALQRLVRSLDMVPAVFSSGRQFLELLDALPTYRPDCLVLDVQMPGLTGLDVQNRLHRTHRDLPVVFITAHDDLDVRTRALAAGAAGYLRKPFDDAVFEQALSSALQSRGSSAGNAH